MLKDFGIKKAKNCNLKKTRKTHSLLFASKLFLRNSSKVIPFAASQSTFSWSNAFLRSSNSRIWSSSAYKNFAHQIFTRLLMAKMLTFLRSSWRRVNSSSESFNFCFFSFTFISNTCSISASIFFIFESCSRFSSSIWAKGFLQKTHINYPLRH